MTPAFTLSAAALVLVFAGDAMANPWLAQQALTSSYAFEVQATKLDALFQVKAIRVLDRRTGEPVQHMEVGETPTLLGRRGLVRATMRCHIIRRQLPPPA